MSSLFHVIILKTNYSGGTLKLRNGHYGDSNVIGKNVERLRKARGYKQKDFIARLQTAGLDINPTSYSKLEGQLRAATDREVYAIAKALQVPMEALYENA